MAGTLEYPSMSPPAPATHEPEAALVPDEEEDGAWSPPDPPLAGEEASLSTPAPSRQTERLVAEVAKTRDPRLRDPIVLMHDRMVRYLASRFDSRLSPQEDVVQVAYIALITPINRFDPKTP